MNLSFLAPVVWLLFFQQNFDWVSFNMIKRTNAQGKTARMDARIYFRSNGDMVTYLTEPSEMFILNNAKGELQIYNAKENSVFKSVNYDYGSQNNTFYYFLGQIPNMGLEKVGYKIGSTKIDGSYLVTTWFPPKNLKAEIKSVEVVSDGEQTIFMGFLDNDDAYFKKIFFYDFSDLRGIPFPKTIAEIDFVKEDSIITKTTFQDFEFNNVQDKEILDFQIPKSATLLK